MEHKKNHDYHILQPSIWPLISALSAFIMLTGSVLFFHEYGPAVMIIGLLMVLYCMYGWWPDVIVESNLIINKNKMRGTSSLALCILM